MPANLTQAVRDFLEAIGYDVWKERAHSVVARYYRNDDQATRNIKAARHLGTANFAVLAKALEDSRDSIPEQISEPLEQIPWLLERIQQQGYGDYTVCLAKEGYGVRVLPRDGVDHHGDLRDLCPRDYSLPAVVRRLQEMAQRPAEAPIQPVPLRAEKPSPVTAQELLEALHACNQATGVERCLIILPDSKTGDPLIWAAKWHTGDPDLDDDLLDHVYDLPSALQKLREHQTTPREALEQLRDGDPGDQERDRLWDILEAALEDE